MSSVVLPKFRVSATMLSSKDRTYDLTSVAQDRCCTQGIHAQCLEGLRRHLAYVTLRDYMGKVFDSSVCEMLNAEMEILLDREIQRLFSVGSLYVSSWSSIWSFDMSKASPIGDAKFMKKLCSALLLHGDVRLIGHDQLLRRATEAGLALEAAAMSDDKDRESRREMVMLRDLSEVLGQELPEDYNKWTHEVSVGLLRRAKSAANALMVFDSLVAEIGLLNSKLETLSYAKPKCKWGRIQTTYDGKRLATDCKGVLRTLSPYCPACGGEAEVQSE